MDNSLMKKLLSITLLLVTTLTAKAQTLEAKSLKGLLGEIQSAKFQYKDRGMIFGFNTIQSCLYVSEDIAIIKNYCYPVKQYPARGFTIISKKYGMVDIYEETIDVIKHDVVYTQFPEVMAPYLTTRIPDTTTEGMSDMIEKMYHRYYPGCWSTNYSWDLEAPTASCTSGYDIVNYDMWSQETQKIVNTDAEWMSLFNLINSKIQ